MYLFPYILGNYHLAEPLFEECFDLRRKTLGPLHISSLKSMYSVSCMMFNQAEYELAEALMRECLDLRRTALGATHLDTVASLQKLAVLYEIQKDYPAAELLYHEYLHASMAVYGNDHVNTINALYLLGVNYKNQFKYSLAEQVLRITIDKYRATLSADHDCTLRAIYDLAALYEDVAQYENSLTVRTQYFDLCKARFGEEVSHKSHHKTPAAAKVNKANQNHNILPIAEDEKVQNLAQKGCAKTHQCMYDLAGLHVKMGKCSRALPLLMRCLELRLQQIGASHVDTLATQNQLAYVHINSGNYDAAEALLVQSIEEGSRMNAAMQADANNDGSGNKKKQAQQNAAPNISLSHNSHIGGDPEHHHVRFSAEAVLGEADYYDTPYLAISNGEPHHSQSNDYIQSNSHEGSNRSLLSNNEEVLREEVEMRLPAVVDAMNNLGLMYTEQVNIKQHGLNLSGST